MTAIPANLAKFSPLLRSSNAILKGLGKGMQGTANFARGAVVPFSNPATQLVGQAAGQAEWNNKRVMDRYEDVKRQLRDWSTRPEANKLQSIAGTVLAEGLDLAPYLATGGMGAGLRRGGTSLARLFGRAAQKATPAGSTARGLYEAATSHPYLAEPVVTTATNIGSASQHPSGFQEGLRNRFLEDYSDYYKLDPEEPYVYDEYGNLVPNYAVDEFGRPVFDTERSQNPGSWRYR
jgi:hypothetical protein